LQNPCNTVVDLRIHCLPYMEGSEICARLPYKEGTELQYSAKSCVMSVYITLINLFLKLCPRLCWSLTTELVTIILHTQQERYKKCRVYTTAIGVNTLLLET